MDNFLSGGIAELEAAKKAVMDDAASAQAAQEAERALKSREKDLEAQKKFMNDKIASTIRNRREELEKTHEEQVAEARKNLRNAEKNRRLAKTDAVNNRIKEETSALIASNARIKEETRAMFKQARVPGFCNSNLYYALFSPRTIGDFLVFAAMVLLTVAVIPNVVCALLKVSTLAKVFIYIGIVVFFLAIYFLILVGTRGGSKAGTIARCRPNIDRIRINKKKVRQLSKNIRKDSDESNYGLEDYDAEISRCSQLVEEKTAAKNTALDEFDAQTAPSLKSEIENENMPMIHQMEEETQALRADLQAKKTQAEAAANELSNSYLAYLGNKNASPEKIDELIAIIRDGKAETIMQALDIQKGEITK